MLAVQCKKSPLGLLSRMDKEQKSAHRLRIAPSPTGYPHIGTIYQALFNFAYARKYNGSFIVRIEDTDQKRFVEDAEKVIFSSLDWFGLTEDESPRMGGQFSPYRQSERLAIYRKYANELLKNGHAYFSYLPKKEAGEKKNYDKGKSEQAAQKSDQKEPKTIEEMMKRGDWVLRMKIPTEQKTITVHDEIRGDITFPTSEVTSQVLLKSDGFPTYHLAVVVDDHLMRISHVLRAEEWISSLPKHVLLYKYFNWQMPPIYHTADLRNPDKSKLSKRHGHTNVQWFREEGYLPEAVLNFLALLGWSHPEGREIFSLEEFIKLFQLNDIRAVAPVFDLRKLQWMNQQYIQQMTYEQLKKKLISFDPTLQNISQAMFDQLLPLVHTRMQTLKEFLSLTKHFFIEPPAVEDTALRKVASDLYTLLEKTKEWKSELLLAACKQVMQAHKVRMPALYLLLTGDERGLPLPESLVILGKDKTMRRLGFYA